MFVEFVRNLATTLGMIFHYGRRDFQNLVETTDENDPEVYLFLDPVVRKYEFSRSTGLRTGYTYYSGNMMMLTKADLDQEYDAQTGVRPVDEGKWRTNIMPKLNDIIPGFTDDIACVNDEAIQKWEIRDGINLLDENMDGLIITFEIKFDERDELGGFNP